MCCRLGDAVRTERCHVGRDLVSSRVEERPFVGGNFSRARRVGDTVRRDAGPWTPTVHELLRHLRAQGFTAAPEPLAFDEREETLRYIEGDTYAGWPDPMPAWMFGGEAELSAARLLRAFHDRSVS